MSRSTRWDELVGQIGEEGCIDLILVAGWYHAISFTVRALRLEQEPGTPLLSARRDDTTWAT